MLLFKSKIFYSRYTVTNEGHQKKLHPAELIYPGYFGTLSL